MRAARRIPAVIINWYMEVKHPRKLDGASSLWYRETTVLRSPIESPETKRPHSIMRIESESTCMQLPERKMADPRIMEFLRPQPSKK